MQKDEKLNITKEKLLDATFALMEEADDPLAVTSRQIAERAGTKPSMINYCFGSRENLIYQTFQKQYMGFLNEKEVAKVIASVLFNRDLSQESFSYAYVKKHYAGRKTDKECKLIAYEMSSMMQLIVCRKEDIKKDFGIDLNKEKELRKYIDMRIDLLLGE